MKSLCAVLFLIGAPVSAQTRSDWFFTLGNGAEVYYQVWSGIELQRGVQAFSDVHLADNVVERTLRDLNGTPLLGFDIHFDQVPGSNDFDISFSAVPDLPFFSRAPEPRRVHNADRVLLDVLQEVGTGKKVFDTFEVVVDDTPHAELPLPTHNVPDMIPAKTTLRLSHPRLAYDAYEPLPMAQQESVSSSQQVSIEAPMLGRFTLSSEPGPGYRLEAIAEDNEVRFDSGNDLFSISCDAPVVDRPGAWYLWVKFEPLTTMPTVKTMPSHDGPPPLDLTLSPTKLADGVPASLVQIQNISSKNVLAYTIRVTGVNPSTGKPRPGRTHAVLRMRTDGTLNLLFPGQIAADKVQGSNSAASVDLVVFDDGSGWGPMTSDAAKHQWKAIQQSLRYAQGMKE